MAALFTAAAFGLRWALDPALGNVQPFAFFYVSVAFAAWFGGQAPAALASVAGLVMGSYFFLSPRLGWGLAGLVPMLTYAVVSASFVALLSFARRSERAAISNAAQLRDAQAELRQRHALMDGIAQSVPDGILVVAPGGRTVYANDRFQQVWRFPPEVLAAQSDEVALEWAKTQVADPAAFITGVRRAYQTPDQPVREPLVMQDGRVYDRFGAPVVRNGENYGWVWTFRDITEHRAAEEKLRANEQAYRDLAAKLEGEQAVLRAVIENLPVGIGIGDTSGGTLSLNWVGLELHGFKSEAEMYAKIEQYVNVFDLLDLGGRVLPLAEWPGPRAVRGEYVHDFHVQLRNNLKQTQRIVGYSVAPVRNAAGETTLIVYVLQDLTEQKRAAQALQESEERFRAVAENIPQLAWMTDARGTMLWFNQRWLHYTGLGLEQMQAGGWQAVHDPAHGRVSEGWLRALATGEPWEDTFPLRSREGDFRWFLSRAFPIHDEAGRVVQWFGTNTDVTELRETEAALQQAHEELQARAQALEATVADRTARLRQTIQELEAFSYSLSHDMRAPLRAMRSFSQILETRYGGRLGPDGLVFLGKIAAAAGRLDLLIRDVLTYSRIAREQVTLQPIDVERLVRQLIDENPLLQPPQAAIEVIRPLQPMRGHEAHLMQVLSNLVYNAVKFVAAGQQPQVRIWTEPRGDQVRLCVRDNGIGIPLEAQERMFGLFQRLHPAGQYEGTGIGLTIVLKAVERMGGRVGVESEPGAGSLFWVELAAVPPADPAAAADVSGSPPAPVHRP